jgi:hypothetical protein
MERLPAPFLRVGVAAFLYIDIYIGVYMIGGFIEVVGESRRSVRVREKMCLSFNLFL